MEELTSVKKDYEKALEEGVRILLIHIIVEYFALERHFGSSHVGFCNSSTAESRLSIPLGHF